MSDTSNEPEPPRSDSGPVGRSGGAPRFEVVTEQPFQRQRRLEHEGNVARWTFFGGLRASTRSEAVTVVLLAANCAVFAAMVTWGVGFLQPSNGDLLTWGANQPLLTRDGQPWRLLTACFLHVGLIHLAVNMWSLWSMRFVEHWFGHFSFAVLYLVTGLCGSLASTALGDPFIPSAGASGALFGVFGAVLGAALRWKRLGVDSRVTGPILQGVLKTIVLNAVIALSIRNLDHFAHGGGFVSGIVLGYLLAHAPTAAGVAGRARRGLAVAAVSSLAIVALVLALRVPGLAAAGERAEGLRSKDVEVMERLIAMVTSSASDLSVSQVPMVRNEWLPYVTFRANELRSIEATYPILRSRFDAQLRWYDYARDRMTEQLARVTPR